MLRLEVISKKFNEIQVLNGFSCTVQQGDFVVIMGPNGTGKSTLFDVISGKTAPDSGRVLIDGIDITLLPERKRTGLIARLFQNTSLGCCSTLTVRENLAMATLRERQAGLQDALRSFPEEIVELLLKPLKLNLENHLETPMGALSGGQRQIISFIMSILKPPKILLLDEPTAALDPNSATQLLAFAKNYANAHQIPALLITHDPIVAKHLGNRLWIIEGGCIKREFGPEKSELDPRDFFHQIDAGCLGLTTF